METADRAGFDSALSALEQQVAHVAQAALKSEPELVQAAAAQLRAAVEAWGRTAAQWPEGFALDEPLRRRMQAVGAAMQSAREGLLRRAAHSGLALQAMLPPDAGLTYSSSGGTATARLRGRGGYAA